MSASTTAMSAGATAMMTTAASVIVAVITMSDSIHKMLQQLGYEPELNTDRWLRVEPLGGGSSDYTLVSILPSGRLVYGQQMLPNRDDINPQVFDVFWKEFSDEFDAYYKSEADRA